MDKGGISAVVATVLIILITVVAVTIVWTNIIPMVKDNLEFSELDGGVEIVTSGGYTVYDAERGIAIVQVQRDVDDLDMSGVRILFSVNGSSYGSSVVAPEPGQTRVYNFNLSSYGRPDSVSVIPIIVIGNLEKEGGVTSGVDINSGKIYEVSGFVYELEQDYAPVDCNFDCSCDEGVQDYETHNSPSCNEDIVYVDCWTDTCWTETASDTYAWGGSGINEPTDSCVGIADRPACNYCDDLVYGGFSDWELPTTSELYYLVLSDSCSGTCFGGDGEWGYWSSIEYYLGSFSSWIVGFSVTPNVMWQGKDQLYYVRCVRE